MQTLSGESTYSPKGGMRANPPRCKRQRLRWRSRSRARVAHLRRWPSASSAAARASMPGHIPAPRTCGRLGGTCVDLADRPQPTGVPSARATGSAAIDAPRPTEPGSAGAPPVDPECPAFSAPISTTATGDGRSSRLDDAAPLHGAPGVSHDPAVKSSGQGCPRYVDFSPVAPSPCRRVATRPRVKIACGLPSGVRERGTI
jgi:hypothetical protein